MSEIKNKTSNIKSKPTSVTDKNTRWALMVYDFFVFIFISMFLFLITYRGYKFFNLDIMGMLFFTLVSMAITVSSRYIFKVYNQIWRFGGIQSFVRMLFSDFIAFIVLFLISRFKIPFLRLPSLFLIAFSTVQLLVALAMRMVYRLAYKCGGKDTVFQRVLALMFRIFAGYELDTVTEAAHEDEDPKKNQKTVIFGAGRTGVSLCDDLFASHHLSYLPVAFVDVSPDKIGRSIYNIPVLSQEKATNEYLRSLGVNKIIFAIPTLGADQQKVLYDYYKDGGFGLKVYDYPVHEGSDEEEDEEDPENPKQVRRQIRDFTVEDLLFRKPVTISNEKTKAFYTGKTVMITGGGGSIGSELCRQIARMKPEKIVIVDVYENGAYEVQQELNFKYNKDGKTALNLFVEIISVCNMEALDRVFDRYRPDIVLHAAAHKHVPLMEHNCCEAVENNVFGTLNVVLCSEKYKVKRFMMVSTDKAVNPTNVMGATKRMCELIVQSHSNSGSETTFSATRFGNVLGSTGSVIPLFKSQIANGGPVTITDPRIIRYFMTIPEASQLVLQSASMAKNGELFVLNMGQPVKIYDLAINMIKMSGYEPDKDIKIKITGLRPGEKLFEELLVKTEELNATENSMIFIEKDKPLGMEEVDKKLDVLRAAVATGNDDTVREALKSVIPTYVAPEIVNAEAAKSYEMQHVRTDV